MMKNLIFAFVLAISPLSYGKVCKGTYESPYRTLEVDGQGQCSMEADGGIFSGDCEQEADGSVMVYLGGNGFSGQFSADCSQLEMAGVIYKKVK